LADPKLRESLYCIRCGACLNICPVYQKVGGHAYGWVYPGPIGAIVTPSLVGLKQAKDLPFASSLCGACREVCPVKINIPRMLLHLRQELTESSEPAVNSTPALESILARCYTAIMSHPTLLSMGTKLFKLLQMPVARNGRIQKAPFAPLSRWSRSRDMNALPQGTFRAIWRRELSGPNQSHQ